MLPPRTVLATFLLLVSCASTAGLSPEKQFAAESASLTSYEGGTSEPSCSGTTLTVYLKGDQIRHLDWGIEMSYQFVRCQYFYSDSPAPVLVIETIDSKFDPSGKPLKSPRLKSTTRHDLSPTSKDPRKQEFLDHAAFLAKDFATHRSDFIQQSSP